MIKLKQKWKNQRLWVKLTFMVLVTVALTDISPHAAGHDAVHHEAVTKHGFGQALPIFAQA